jgi:hypothetical protein
MNTNPRPRIIAFAGRKRTGKTTLAKTLQKEVGAKIITIADYLKHLCCELMNMSYDELIEKKDNGYTFDVVADERWLEIIHENTGIDTDDIRKEIQDTHFTSIRQLLQVIGTDVIRKYNKDWHVNKMVDEINSMPKDCVIAIDDVRFPNEVDAILRLSGEVFFIVRPNVSEISNHASETALTWQCFDEEHVILNSNISLDKLKVHFMIHYFEGFDKRIKKSIMLSENMEYTKCGMFGYKNMQNDDELLSDILSQIKEDGMFINYGIIRYHTFSKELAKRYAYEVAGRPDIDLHERSNGFMTYNPLITENLKVYM